MTSFNNDSSSAWSNYWKKGFLTTFVGAKDENYSGAIGDYWAQVFESLESKHHMVDLAAGNGALLSLASNYLKNSNIDIEMTAVDLADIKSSNFYKSNPEINIVGNTSLTHTLIETSTVDLCVSQFGFEYADEQAAVSEVSRILKPSGKFTALIHNVESEITMHSKSALEQIRLCSRSELTQTTQNLLRRLQRLKKKNRNTEEDIKANEMRDYFNSMANRLKKYAEKLPDSQHIDYFLNELGNLFGAQAKQMSLEEKLSIILDLENDSKNYQVRMQSMVDASKNQVTIDKLKQVFIENSFEVMRIEPLMIDRQGHAWVFEAIKR